MASDGKHAPKLHTQAVDGMSLGSIGCCSKSTDPGRGISVATSTGPGANGVGGRFVIFQLGLVM